MPEDASTNFRFTIEYIPEADFFWLSYFGEPELDDLGRVFAALRRHEDYRDQVDVLIDMRQASARRLTANNFRRIREYLEAQADRHDVKQANVVASNVDYGLVRMSDSLFSDDVPQTRRVFRDIDEALQWLRPGHPKIVETDLINRDRQDDT